MVDLLRPRLLWWIPPLAACLIAAGVVHKQAFPQYSWLKRAKPARADAVRPAPLFQLYDQHSQIVRVARYIGRHRLLVIFLDPRTRPDAQGLAELRPYAGEFRKANIIVLCVGQSRPSEHRQQLDEAQPFPFPVLTDLDGSVYRRWGAYNEQTSQPLPAVFAVNRAGSIARGQIEPKSLSRSAIELADLPQTSP